MITTKISALFIVFVFILMGSTLVFAEPFETVLNNGNPANRVDIAVLGDGYTAAQMMQYRADVQTFITQVFAQEPYKEYQRYFNVHRIDVTSAESGADHPERMPPVFVNTALDATFNCNGIQRLVCVNTTTVNQIVNNTLPASTFDIILVIVNDAEYGGSGGQIAVASTNPGAFAELILHEVGHSFGLLADEYAGGGPQCNPNVEPPEVNATRETNRPLIKWTVWIDAGTPVPTTTTMPAIPGLYEGSRYCDNGLYRPTFNDKMRTIGLPFEQITREQHIKRIHQFMSPIDASSPAGNTVAITTAQSQTFTITPLVPFTHTLNINWTVNGNAAGTGANLNLNGATLPVGQHVVQAVVTDPTVMVRNDPTQLLRATRNWTVTVTQAPAAGIRAPFDYDGDDKTDISIYRPGSGQWWYQRSSNGLVTAGTFGNATDKIMPADFTGDQKADWAFFRPSTNEWYVLRSENLTFYAFPFGAAGDVPVTGDFDGDGKADATVQRPSTNTWFISKSTGGTDIIPFGTAGDRPVVADYDGDGKTDIAIWRPSVGQWWIRRSSDASVLAATFGSTADKPVQGYWTADNKADMAFWRPTTGEWFVLRSEDFSFFAVPFGTTNDVPVPGDYDGDDRFDTAVFRPSTNTWFVNRTTAGTLIQAFGATGDQPTPNAYVP
ncbi:MAG: VCBS repeat-containing protein [Blastocatellia bacterium]|nr:VCBS repeat-containing protein [Blastocatellia bacterium]